jgi:TatD DNase family protein
LATPPLEPAAVVRYADSHAHLAAAEFDPDREEVIARARTVGCRAMICIGESVLTAERASALAATSPHEIFFTAGVHPHDAQSWTSDTAAQLRAFVDRGAVAIGECGLDYHYDHSPREVQRRVFDAQLALAAATGRPVVVHSREAESDTIAALRAAASAGVRGVLHCFSGSADLGAAAMEAGWFVSFSGVITFKRWDDDALIRDLPRGRWLVESDAPYLAPVPFRGKRNEPAHVIRTLAKVASVRSLSLREAAEESWAATADCFAIPLLAPTAAPASPSPSCAPS